VETEELAGYHPSDSGETDLTAADDTTVEAETGERPEDVAVEITAEIVVEAEPEIVDVVAEADAETADAETTDAEADTAADTVVEAEPETAPEDIAAEPVDEIETPIAADEADKEADADTGEEKL